MIINANALHIPLKDNSVHCVVTSPPYWGLRDYGTASWEGGDDECDHKQTTARHDGGRVNVNGFHGSATEDSDKGAMNYRDTCGKCGATRIDNQIGLEKTPEEYVEKMVAVFREIKRVLRVDGTAWLNLGDSYASGKGTCYNPGGNTSSFNVHLKAANVHPLDRGNKSTLAAVGLKPKDLVGIPWRVAFALQADGWWLRSDIIWSKPNPMPESVTDRPTKAHEYIFLLTKSEKYYYDADAVREPYVPHSLSTQHTGPRIGIHKPDWNDKRDPDTTPIPQNPAGRNIRTVWEIATQPYPNAHFATFPEEIAKRCIMAGTSERGCCAECGAPWERVVEKSQVGDWRSTDRKLDLAHGAKGGPNGTMPGYKQPQTLGWQPTCSHNAATSPCVVLDPFAGSGTTIQVAQDLGRIGIGLELKPDYCRLAIRRSAQFGLLLHTA